MRGPQIAMMPDSRRLHLQFGPIDMIVEADGARREVAAAYRQAIARFRTILPELVAELPRLRQPVGDDNPADSFTWNTARRMVEAAGLHHGVFVTPMAGVAGAHALSPSLLELEETGGGRVELRFKTPSLVPAGSADLRPELPPSCRPLEPASATEEGTATIVRWAVDCGEAGLTGARVGIAGLAERSTDAETPLRSVRLTNPSGPTLPPRRLRNSEFLSPARTRSLVMMPSASPSVLASPRSSAIMLSRDSKANLGCGQPWPRMAPHAGRFVLTRYPSYL